MPTQDPHYYVRTETPLFHFSQAILAKARLATAGLASRLSRSGRERCHSVRQTALTIKRESLRSAARLGVPPDRVAYLVKVLGIRPLGRAGRLRVFAEVDIDRIARAIGRNGGEGARS